jgi:hypothetical protein
MSCRRLRGSNYLNIKIVNLNIHWRFIFGEIKLIFEKFILSFFFIFIEAFSIFIENLFDLFCGWSSFRIVIQTNTNYMLKYSVTFFIDII